MRKNNTPAEVAARLAEIQEQFNRWQGPLGDMPLHLILWRFAVPIGTFYDVIDHGLLRTPGHVNRTFTMGREAYFSKTFRDIAFVVLTLCNKLNIPIATALQECCSHHLQFPVDVPDVDPGGSMELFKHAGNMAMSCESKSNAEQRHSISNFLGSTCFRLCAAYTKRSLWDILDEGWLHYAPAVPPASKPACASSDKRSCSGCSKQVTEAEYDRCPMAYCPAWKDLPPAPPK